MASHFVSVTRGGGLKYSDFTTGTASSGVTGGLELRLDDASTMRATDVADALEQLQAFFRNPAQWATAGFVIAP
jgi:hypothetical protein